MNHRNPYFDNNVKMTDSAFESPGDAATVLLQWMWLLLVIFGIRIEERVN